MISLYVNTTDVIHVGILDKDFSWIIYKETNETKASDVLHALIYELLEKNNISLDQVQNVFSIAGPGSYTGLRLGEGFSQTLTLANINHYSFYLTDVFSILNIPKALFFSNAFKNETYVYEKNMKEERAALVKNFCRNNYDKTNAYTLKGEDNTKPIFELIKDNSKKIFSYVLEYKIKKDIFYYRSLDEEFSQ